MTAGQLRKRYTLTLALTAALLLAAIFAYGWSSFFRQRTVQLTELHAQGDQLQLALVDNIQLARDHVLAMRRTVERNLRYPVVSDSSFADRLMQRNQSPLRDAPWERLPHEIAMETGAVHVDPGASLDGGTFRRDLSAASGMLAETVSTHSLHKVFQWSYYYDAGKRWWLVYPPQTRDELMKATASTEMAAAFKVLFDADGTLPVESAGPERNAAREIVWTPPYLDASGKGMMVTALAPVYLGDSYTGTVGTDVTLELLDNVLLQHPLKMGRAVISDGLGFVVADTGKSLAGSKGKVKLADVLPTALSEVALAGKDPEFMRFQLRGTGWTLLVQAPPRELNALALGQLKPYFAMAILLLLAIVGLAYIQNRQFTLPALQLVDYVDQVEANPGKRPPPVPAFWKHWFVRVALGASERRKLQAASRQHATELEAKVTLRTTELRGANASLSNALDTLQKTQKQLVRSEKLASLGGMVAGVAHELNTPLGNALLANSTLKERQTTLAEQLQSGLRRSDLDTFLADFAESNALIERNLETASRLVTRFKEIATDPTQEPPQTFRLHEVANNAITAAQQAVPRPDIRIINAVPRELEMHSYVVACSQVIHNLLTNAMTHAFEGRSDGIVRVHAGTQRLANGNDVVTLTVKDNGCGIAADVLPRVFDPFFTTRMGRATGLGLNIVQNVVEGALKGTIDIESSADGTLFTLTLLQHLTPSEKTT
jgi:signal transduction histidine kinase